VLTRRSWVSLLACFVGLLALLAAAAVMALNLGGITSALRDVQYSTLAQLHPGVAAGPARDLAVTHLATIDAGKVLRNAAALWPQLLLLLIAGGLMLVLVARGQMLWAALFVVVVIAAALGGSWLLFARAQLFLDMLSPSIALAIGYFSALLIFAIIPAPRAIRTTEEIAKGPPETAAPVAAVPVRPRRPAERREVTYVVCRLRGVGGSNSALEPAGAITLLDSAATPMLEAVAQHRGSLVYASGNQFAAVWNAPSFDDGDHAVHACEAALRMLAGFTGLKDTHGEGTPYDPLQLGIGIATGPAVVSDPGNRNDGYSVLGDCVDIADRLSELSGRYGPAILVSEETRNAAEKTFALLEIDTLALRPDGKAMKVYALYGNPLVRASPKFRALSSFHDHLFQAIRAQRWSDARTLIGQCNNLSGAIPQLYDLHLARIGWYESHPLPSDWDGAFRPPVL
jgi:adenylate cyclase